MSAVFWVPFLSAQKWNNLKGFYKTLVWHCLFVKR
jgi:hypothetical protein